jgi:hypothetical protein
MQDNAGSCQDQENEGNGASNKDFDVGCNVLWNVANGHQKPLN